MEEKTTKKVETKKSTTILNLDKKNETKKESSNENNAEMSAEPEIVSREKLLEAGTYFGHRVSQWNPKMKQYIYGKRMGIHIIDIAKTQKALEYAYKILYKMALKPISFIWVGTKKQAKKAIEEAAARTNSVYVSERWLGGTLTNSQTIFKSVRVLEDLEEKKAAGYVGRTKKEGLECDKKIAKLQKNLGGIRKLANKASFPQVMICASPLDDEIAIKEAKKKGIKIFAINDTNTNPDLAEFVIPGNDDSTKSLTLILTILADAICAARGNKQLFAYKSNEEIILPEEQKRDGQDKQNHSKYQNNRMQNARLQRPFVKKEAKVTTEETSEKEKEVK